MIGNGDEAGMKADALSEIKRLGVPIPSGQTATLFLGPRGTPVKCLFDSGAAVTFMLESKADEIGLPIRKPQNPMRLRLANGSVSTHFIDKKISSCTMSALNGEVNETIPQVLLLNSMPPNTEMIVGRDVIYGLLHGALMQHRLECYAEHQPSGEYPPGPTPMSARKYIVFDRPVQQGLADLCGASVNVNGCGDIEELHFADGKEFDALHIQVAEDMANRAMVDTYRALSLPAKKRTAAQRQLLARAKHLDAEARDRLLHTGPMPTGQLCGNGQPATLPLPATMTPSKAKRFVRKPSLLYSSLAGIITTLLVMFSQAATTADAASVTVESPSEWCWSDSCGNDTSDWESCLVDTDELEAAINDDAMTFGVWSNDQFDEHQGAAADLEQWHTELGFVAPTAVPMCAAEASSVDDADTTAGATMSERMAAASGAAAKSDMLPSEKLSLPITRERWFPLLNYEAVTHPAAAGTLRGRLREAGFDVTVAQIRQAMDVIDPDVVTSSAHEPPPEGGMLPSTRIPEDLIDTPFKHMQAWAKSVRAAVERFGCLKPIETFDPPAHQRRLKFEVKDGKTIPRMNSSRRRFPTSSRAPRSNRKREVGRRCSPARWQRRRRSSSRRSSRRRHGSRTVAAETHRALLAWRSSTRREGGSARPR